MPSMYAHAFESQQWVYDIDNRGRLMNYACDNERVAANACKCVWSFFRG